MSEIVKAIEIATGKIAPVWPLDQFVAVNPYYGLADLTFRDASQQLASIAGAKTTMPSRFYLDKIASGQITPSDISESLNQNPFMSTSDPEEFIELVEKTENEQDVDSLAFEKNHKSVSDVAGEIGSKDWTRFKIDRISYWASSHFDKGQVIWPTANRKGKPFESWKESASFDKTTEIMGLKGFRKTISSLPNDPIAAIDYVVSSLNIPSIGLVDYFHKLLLEVGGWSANASRIVFEAALGEQGDKTLQEFLAVLVCFEYGIVKSQDSSIFNSAWKRALVQYETENRSEVNRRNLDQLIVLQEAFDIASQRELIETFSKNKNLDNSKSNKFDAQIVFCIDVRSEVYRRNLESVSDRITTIGFAGFFGFAAEHIRIGHQTGENQCPVLLNTSFKVNQSTGDSKTDTKIISHRSLRHHVRRAWKSFKMGAVTCFSFVGPVGLIYLPKLFTDSYGITRPIAKPENEALPSEVLPILKPDVSHIPLEEKISMAAGALRAMSLTKDLADLIVLSGHGSSTVNNPYGNGLDCGACGGNSGEQNAKIAAAIFNDNEVRQGLTNEGIVIPEETTFIAGLHDTTTDNFELFNIDQVPNAHKEKLQELQNSLTLAGKRSRIERSPRLGIDPSQNIDSIIESMSKDWSEVRPEWGLANCRAFVAAPRERTRDLNLKGRTFLHSYDWRADKDFSILNLIMTAPVVVASWINLQYYASTVEGQIFGSGNKTLHNVVSKLGVLEGNAGDLRVGLPIQSVHDGEKFQHDPLRLAVIIEAPTEAINEVLKSNEHVRNLFNNQWLFLFTLNEEGRIAKRYIRDFEWKSLS